ncbi:MAG: hypothetical protein OJF49_004192 [Ktedonobacterales bacterium]|nr:MAG: hypothetical protein OJF49_004192 [Ktedonobacterales bacterium]
MLSNVKHSEYNRRYVSVNHCQRSMRIGNQTM